MPSSPSPAACIGKVPTHGDFVRHRASTPTMRAFDEWIRKGLRRAGRAWEETYDRTPTMRFFLFPRGRRVPNALLGVLRASRDRNGRAYPFAVTCELPKSSVRADRLAALPLQAESFYSAAEEIVQEAIDGPLSHHEVTDRVAGLDPSFSVPSSPPPTYNQFVREQTVGPLLETVFGHFEDGGKYRLFKNLLDIFLPQRKRDAPRLNYGLQFPLGAGTVSPTKTACFWLDSSLHLLNHPHAACSFFWTPHAPDARPSFLLLFVGPSKADAVFHLLGSDGQNENICKLEHMGNENDAQVALSIPDEYGALLEDDQRPLREFLQRL